MTGHVFIYGYIGRNQGENSVTTVKNQIDPSAEEYVVHIVSGGGDVFEGYGIYNVLKNTGKKITVMVEGVCASIATLIAAAGQEIIMNRTSEFMIHNPQISDLKGDAKQLRSVADQLDKIKGLLIDVYQKKTGLTNEKLWELYDNETWLTAQEAQKMGFVDDVQDAIKAVASVDLKQFRMEKTENAFTKFFKNLIGLKKFKNEFTETLQDGTVIIVMSDDEDWTGKQVIYEDGSAVPAGNYVLATGKTITVDEQSNITQVSEAAPADKNDEEMDNKIKELEAQLAEAKAAKEQAVAAAQAAEAKTAEATTKFENRIKVLESDYLKLKEAASVTVGDDEPVNRKGPVFKNTEDPAKDYDPMGEEVKKYLKGRNRI